MRLTRSGPVVVTLVVAAAGPFAFSAPAVAAPAPIVRVATPGLPTWVVPRLAVTGPGAYSRVARTRTLTLPASGTYRVAAGIERRGAFAYRPSVASRLVTVRSGTTTDITVRFTRIAPATTSGRYPIGTFAGVDLWVDPLRGSDSRSGATRATALRTVGEAWSRIPARTALTRGYRINLVRGTYPESVLVNYWEHRWGTALAPIVIRSADGPHTARFTGDMNVYDVRHLYVMGVDIIRAGDAFHCERCSHIVLRGMELSGVGGAHETVKVNQSDHVYIEDSDIHGADDNAIDFVAVTTGHLLGNRIHGAQDWCAYVKGGSAGIAVVDNEIFGCGTGGFTAGQGTGLEFMEKPWLKYEAYTVAVHGNLIHDTDGAGLGVNGGYNVTIDHNTLYRVGRRSHAVEFVQGSRGCDGDTAACGARMSAGGWGTTDTGGQWIPNHAVTFTANLVANPPGYQSQWAHFDVHAPATPPAGSGVPSPARADDGLVISGNVLFNGDGSLDLGFSSGACGAAHPGCAPEFVRAHNVVGASARVFRDPAHGDYRLLVGAVPAGVGSIRVA